jgi:hypothetical protein
MKPDQEILPFSQASARTRREWYVLDGMGGVAYNSNKCSKHPLSTADHFYPATGNSGTLSRRDYEEI